MCHSVVIDAGLTLTQKFKNIYIEQKLFDRQRLSDNFENTCNYVNIKKIIKKHHQAIFSSPEHKV